MIFSVETCILFSNLLLRHIFQSKKCAVAVQDFHNETKTSLFENMFAKASSSEKEKWNFHKDRGKYSRALLYSVSVPFVFVIINQCSKKIASKRLSSSSFGYSRLKQERLINWINKKEWISWSWKWKSINNWWEIKERNRTAKSEFTPHSIVVCHLKTWFDALLLKRLNRQRSRDRVNTFKIRNCQKLVELNFRSFPKFHAIGHKMALAVDSCAMKF